MHKRAQTERNLAHKSEHEPFVHLIPQYNNRSPEELTVTLLTQWKVTQRIPISNWEAEL